jgi:DNA repair protein RadC
MPDTGNKGHRQRLRERFALGEESSRSEEALLELLLTYAIPQKDVQPLAKRLLSEYGSLPSLLETPIETLCNSGGLKENSAILVKLVDWIRQHHGSKRPGKKRTQPQTQATLFETISSEKTEQAVSGPAAPRHEKAVRRYGAQLFGKAVLKEAIDILPKIPLTDSISEITDFLIANLPFNSEQTRARRGRYIKFNMFHNGVINIPLLQFARTFPHTQELRDVCFYQFCRAQPLMVDVIEKVILPRIGIGFIVRNDIEDYLRVQFPESKAIKDGVAAICEALFGAEIALKKKHKIIFALRSIPVASFAFVLHCEFPEPGMYDIRKLDENRMIRAMLWNPERLLHALYELRNQGLISKISEIDNIRQFTTKYTLAGVAALLSEGEGSKARGQME